MYLNCCTERAAEKQRRLELCLLESLQSELYDSISVSGLCQRSGISRKTFYRLFSGKVDVLYALVDHTLLDFQTFRPDLTVTEGETHRFLAFWKSQKPLLDALGKNSASGLLTERALLHILREDPRLIHVFGANDPEYTRETMLFYVSGIFALVMDWHQSGYARSIDEMSELVNYVLVKSPVKPWR